MSVHRLHQTPRCKLPPNWQIPSQWQMMSVQESSGCYFLTKCQLSWCYLPASCCDMECSLVLGTAVKAPTRGFEPKVSDALHQ